MKRNRKVTRKYSVVANCSMRIGAIVVVFGVMVIFNLLSASGYSQLMKAKGECERELAALNDSYTREQARWEEMKTPEKIERTLARNGLLMKLPRPEQTVRMQDDGRPRPGQLSLAKARQRNGLATAQNDSPKSRVRGRSARRQ